jgi:hypothetical protein
MDGHSRSGSNSRGYDCIHLEQSGDRAGRRTGVLNERVGAAQGYAHGRESVLASAIGDAAPVGEADFASRQGNLATRSRERKTTYRLNT